MAHDKLLDGLEQLNSLLSALGVSDGQAPPAERDEPPRAAPTSAYGAPGPASSRTIDTVGVLIEEAEPDAPPFMRVFGELAPGRDFPLDMPVARQQWLRLAAHAWDRAAAASRKPTR